MTRRMHLGFLLVLVALGAAMRFVPHPANVAPVAALALFSGVYLPRRLAVAVPLATMAVSDVVLGFHAVVPFTWGCMALVAVIGLLVRRKKNLWTVIAGSLTGSVVFFIVTNWAVWRFTPLYAKTLSGLGQSYILGLPFFRNTLVGDLFFTAVFFGLAELLARSAARRGMTVSTSEHA